MLEDAEEFNENGEHFLEDWDILRNLNSMLKNLLICLWLWLQQRIKLKQLWNFKRWRILGTWHEWVSSSWAYTHWATTCARYRISWQRCEKWKIMFISVCFLATISFVNQSYNRRILHINNRHNYSWGRLREDFKEQIYFSFLYNESQNRLSSWKLWGNYSSTNR